MDRLNQPPSGETGQAVVKKLESRRLDDGRGAIYFDDELVETYASEAESDAAAILMARMIVITGLGKPGGRCFRDEKPFDLWEEFRLPASPEKGSELQ